MEILSRPVRVGEHPDREQDLLQAWPEIFQAEIARFSAGFGPMPLPARGIRPFAKGSEGRSTSPGERLGKAFFQNREIGFHRNDYQVPPRARVFVHVPRTGGTSVSDYLADVRSPQILNLHAHHPISVVCPPAFHPYFTILRGPVERCWSFYRLTLYGNDATPYRRAAARGLEHFAFTAGKCEICIADIISGSPGRSRTKPPWPRRPGN
jgi:hypothetical protein